MELEVGMYYTRSKKGELGLCKCGNLTPEEFVETYKKRYGVKNASYNIIDLIEVGDYVNGSKVIKLRIDKERDTYTIILDNAKILISEHINSNYLIKSIVTKEQFEAIKYEVK